MKKINLTQRNIELYIKIFFIATNVLALIYLFFFLRENAYKAIVPDRDYIIAESQQISGNVNSQKLEKVIENFEKKSKPRDIVITNNPFLSQ